MRVEFLETTSGQQPVFKFIKKLPKDASARIFKEIEHLAEQGLGLLENSAKLKQLTGYKNLFELRVSFKGVFYRILLCVKDGVIFLLEAFKKKDNHTRAQHIKVAIQRQQLHGLN